MAIIKFTRMERDTGVVRKYGEFWFMAAAKGGGMQIHGTHFVKPAMHGDQEMTVMAEEALACSLEAGLVDLGAASLALVGGPWIKRGAGMHPKAGPFIAYKAPGLIVKVTGARTEIIASPCIVPSARAAGELVAMFEALIGDRDEVRVSSSRFMRTGTVQEQE